METEWLPRLHVLWNGRRPRVVSRRRLYLGPRFAWSNGLANSAGPPSWARSRARSVIDGKTSCRDFISRSSPSAHQNSAMGAIRRW